MFISLVPSPETVFFADQPAGAGCKAGDAFLGGVEIIDPKQKLFRRLKFPAEQQSGVSPVNFEGVALDHRQRKAAQKLAEILSRRRPLHTGTEEVPQPADLTGGGNEEIFPLAPDPAAGFAGDDLGSRGRQHRFARHPDPGGHLRYPAARDHDQNRLGGVAADLELAAVPEEAGEVHETVKELGGQFGVEQNLGVVRLAVDRQEPDDLLLVQREVFQFERDGQRFVEIELPKIVQIAEVFAFGGAQFDRERRIFPLARHMRECRDRVDRQRRQMAVSPVSEFGKTLLAESAIVAGLFLLHGVGELKLVAPGMKNQRDRMRAEFLFRLPAAGAERTGIGSGADPALNHSLGQREATSQPAFPVAPGAGEPSALEQGFGGFELSRTGELNQSVFETFLHSPPHSGYSLLT